MDINNNESDSRNILIHILIAKAEACVRASDNLQKLDAAMK